MLLPHPSLLFYDHQLPQLSRRCSDGLLRLGSALADAGASASAPGSSARLAPPSPATSTMAGSADGSPQPLPGLGSGEVAVAGGAVAVGAVGGGRLSQLLSLGRRSGGRRPLVRLLRQHKTAPADAVSCHLFASQLNCS